MTPEFLAAVIDMLLPGDDALPSGTRAGLDPAAFVEPHRAVFDAIAAEVGGPAVFARTDECTRNAAVRAVERAAPDAFRTLLTAVLANYYEAPAVLAALGWRGEPPQPTGHRVAPFDNSGAERLERVRRRSKLWRDA
jgi:hypothetical protein